MQQQQQQLARDNALGVVSLELGENGDVFFLKFCVRRSIF